MKCRSRIHLSLIALFLLAISPIYQAKAQYMPVVFDRTYGDDVSYEHVCPLTGGEVALVACKDDVTTITWVKSTGEVVFSRTLPQSFTAVNNVNYTKDGNLLILGQSKNWISKKKNKEILGRAIVTDPSGNTLLDIYVGDNGSELFCGQQLKNGSFILGGYEIVKEGVRSGMIAKVDKAGQPIYKYVSDEGGPCMGFDVLGSATEYVHAAFTAEAGTVSTIIRLDSNGKPFFVTKLPEEEFQVNNMITAMDDHIFLIGDSELEGGRIMKIRPEGDIIFSKQIIPASSEASLEYLFITNNGNVLTGGNGDGKSYYSLLRNDGTDLQKYIMQGTISGMSVNPVTGESVIVGFDTERNRGIVIGLSKDGRQIYQKSTDANFDLMHMTSEGIFLAETATGRICMLSPTGNLLFDRYAIEDEETEFEDVFFTSNGDILFKGLNSRLIKMGHGVYVSDITINKPIDGYTTALFTITLTGYPTTTQGTPLPVKIEYFTKQATANETDHFVPSKGSLSFVPTNDGSSHYMIQQVVEVPIKSNNLLEGKKMFEVNLANVDHGYLIKPVGIGTIEDQESLIKLVSTSDGVEGLEDVSYELGIFKTNGQPLINATGSDIIVDGSYGKGTADALDFDMGIAPRVVIGKGSTSGKFSVKTLVDTRYELPKTVVVDFNRLSAVNNGASINFEGSLLSCSATIQDQPARVAIHSLGDHGRMNNTVSGLFKISLLRASDGALLTNATGGDINITCSIDGQTTADEGRDFVLTNMHNLRIWGDGNRSAVNLQGLVLFNPEKTGAKQLIVGIDAIEKPANAPDIRISTNEATAGFTIKE